MPPNLSPETVLKIREAVSSGLTKGDAAKELGLSRLTVIRYTKDIPGKKGNASIRGWSLTLVKELTTKGFYLPSTSQEAKRTNQSYRFLKTLIPVKKVQAKDKVVFYLQGHEKEAMEAFLANVGRKVVGYHEVVPIMKLFGAARKHSKESLFGRLPAETRENFRKSRGKRSL